jgi:hypothetical protein
VRLSCFFLFLASPVVFAQQLTFETTQLQFEAMSGERSWKGEFAFENRGEKPVKIVGVESSCGCVTARAEPAVVQPGEKGKVQADFLFGGRRGPQNKTIVVRTDEANRSATVLTLRGNILELVKVRPNLLFWKKGAEPAAQRLKLVLMKNSPGKVVSVSSSDPRFATELKPESGGEYEVIVTPRNTAEAAIATLTIQTDYPAGKPESYRAYAQVK